MSQRTAHPSPSTPLPKWAMGVCVCTVLLWLAASAGFAADPPVSQRLEEFRIKVEKDREQTVLGRVLLDAQDGGLLVIGRDGKLWSVGVDELVRRKVTDEDFSPLSAKALGEQLRGELGAGFEIVTTKHYVICSNAGRQYSQWCGTLFERLFDAFRNYWKQRGLALHYPEFPLIAIVFANEQQFAAFAQRDAGPDATSSKGYFSITSNRMVMYDLVAEARGAAALSATEFQQRLGTQAFNVATVVHEATHQIAFNSGMHTRYADNPLWLTEGMAMFFETPDLNSKTGWRTVGIVNDLRLKQFRDFSTKRRPADSLATLIQSDARFTDEKLAVDAYAEAWSLSYFLIKNRPADYVRYLERLAAKPRLMWDTPEQRVAEFEEVFGKKVNEIEADWVKAMRRLK
ncbi:MAG: DUF1570 domain-containing protein [Planctomycetales bacterium]|nr:DUF1570 domain-containing protein [Planctomycetales bacterium]